MITSEGSGMQADSMAISNITPRYPMAEITEMTNSPSFAIRFSTN